RATHLPTSRATPGSSTRWRTRMHRARRRRTTARGAAARLPAIAHRTTPRPASSRSPFSRCCSSDRARLLRDPPRRLIEQRALFDDAQPDAFERDAERARVEAIFHRVIEQPRPERVVDERGEHLLRVEATARAKHAV